MARTKISEFSATPGNNTDIDGINLAEGCAPSGINDAIRELMSQLKDFQAGTAGDSFNGPVGTTTAAAGAFTTLSASSTVSGTGFSNYLASPPAIGGTAAAAGSFTTLTTSSTVTHNGGTANGVAYLNGSKVLTTGSALTFDGTNLNVGSATFPSGRIRLKQADDTTKQKGLIIEAAADDSLLAIGYDGSAFTFNPTYNTTGGYKPMAWWVSGSEQMRLTSTGLGIGTSSPGQKLDVIGRIQAKNAAGDTGGVQLYSDVNGDAWLMEYYSRNLIFGNGGSERMRLDSSGNLGLGVTPSAFSASYKGFEIGAVGNALTSASTVVNLSTNAIRGASWTYGTTGRALLYQQDSGSGSHAWYNAASGSGTITFTQAMTLDASGNLEVGNSGQTNTTVNIRCINSGSPYGQLTFSRGSGGVNGFVKYDQSVEAMLFGVGGSERARIDSSGNLLVGKTSASPSTVGVEIQPVGYVAMTRAERPLLLNRLTTDGQIIEFQRQNSTVGSVSVTTTATAYNTSSDYRLKENIQPMTGALAKVAALKPCTYKWKADGSAGEGFIAHELAEVVPQCVTGKKDAVDADGKPVYQGIDTSFLVATLTAAIQELTARVAALESK